MVNSHFAFFFSWMLLSANHQKLTLILSTMQINPSLSHPSLPHIWVSEGQKPHFSALPEKLKWTLPCSHWKRGFLIGVSVCPSFSIMCRYPFVNPVINMKVQNHQLSGIWVCISLMPCTTPLCSYLTLTRLYIQGPQFSLKSAFSCWLEKERDLGRTRLLRKTYKENMEIAAVWK